MSPSFSMRVIPSPDVMFRTIGDEAVLLNLKTEMYLGSDAVGTRMWTVLAEAGCTPAASDVLLREFDVAARHAPPDLDEYIGKLLEHGLIELQPGNAPAHVPALDDGK